MNKEVLRLAGLLACIALATSRIGLVGHELVAHGGIALALGARILDVEMFWFAGGWIRYVLPAPDLASALAIAMAGIALEFVAGSVLWIAVRGATLGRILVRGVGAALVVHATWYLATGAFHGFGDGLILYRVLGAARVPVALAAGIATCMAAYAGARGVYGPLSRTLGGSPRRRLAGVLVAVVAAGGFHAALAIGELTLRRDPTYARTMQPERERTIERELAAWQREQAARGAEPSAVERRAQRVQLERRHASFPFVYLLAIATLVSVVAGAWRSPGGAALPITSRLLARAAVVALVAIWSVIVLDGALPG